METIYEFLKWLQLGNILGIIVLFFLGGIVLMIIGSIIRGLLEGLGQDEQ